jgi:hypothetical protein
VKKIQRGDGVELVVKYLIARQRLRSMIQLIDLIDKQLTSGRAALCSLDDARET